MIVSEIVEINGVSYRRTYSDTQDTIRCGKDRYNVAYDPAGTDKAYFEEVATSKPDEKAPDTASEVQQ